jgi:hypothetical protein
MLLAPDAAALPTSGDLAQLAGAGYEIILLLESLALIIAKSWHRKSSLLWQRASVRPTKLRSSQLLQVIVIS